MALSAVDLHNLKMSCREFIRDETESEMQALAGGDDLTCGRRELGCSLSATQTFSNLFRLNIITLAK